MGAQAGLRKLSNKGSVPVTCLNEQRKAGTRLSAKLLVDF